jgi:hypothetical protein
VQKKWKKRSAMLRKENWARSRKDGNFALPGFFFGLRLMELVEQGRLKSGCPRVFWSACLPGP